ncbi:hypothetical protein V6N11_014413 [Hibiscus sabdariffa]|uniref:Uncharacterized protein n=1 Tax=Hibiscus sabdariffa TaxID=183260 RepID=A0ABR2ADZ4_9ROSI
MIRQNPIIYRKKGTFPRLSDPPSLLAKRSGRHRRGGKGRRVEGVIAEEKVAVLETCAQGWVKEAVSIRVLAKKMATAGLDGFEVIRFYRPGLVALRFRRQGWSALLDTSTNGRIDEVVEIASMGYVFSLVVQEAKLVHVLAIEQREVGAEAAGSEQAREVTMA